MEGRRQSLFPPTILIAVLCAAVAVAQVLPYLDARLPALPPREFPGGVLARITSIYEVDTSDFRTMIRTINKRASVALEDLPLQYLALESWQWLTAGTRCLPKALLCFGPGGAGPGRLAPGVGGALPGAYDGSLSNTDPRSCKDALGNRPPEDPTADALAVSSGFNPTWNDDGQLNTLINDVQFCVHVANSSLMVHPRVLTNVYVTGFRDADNRVLSANQAEGIKLQLHVVGVIPVSWARFINAKFIFNNAASVPLPFYQPEVVDASRVYTNDLNVSLTIIAVLETVRAVESGGDIYTQEIPVCVEPPRPAKGCLRVTFNYYWYKTLAEYKLKTYVVWRKNNYTEVASDQPHPSGAFNVSQGPWPVIEWLREEETVTGVWTQRTFPQREYVYQSDCKRGSTCYRVPQAPSARHLHSAAVYTTWGFRDQAWRYLCNEVPECGQDCLTNLTCLGGVNYFQSNFFFRSTVFQNDDGGVVAESSLMKAACPSDCCYDRRLCMRVNDVLGYEVPFSSEMMLIFGGKTYQHIKDPADGRLIYHKCERISKTKLKKEWLSCGEQIVDDLWRYDIASGKWEYLKPDSAIDADTGLPVGYPMARYGHAVAVVENIDINDKNFKRYFMYMYGGLSLQCGNGGVCNDVWKYEIPWAAQAYYPKFSTGDWIRGNQWFKMKDCPFGGRYRHAMVATSGMEYIFVFGGQVIGKFEDSLLRYRISTDMWEDLDPFGSISLTRLMYDYKGVQQIREVPLKEYDRRVDVDCPNAWRFDGVYSHCSTCRICGLKSGTRDHGSSLPDDRGDTTLTAVLDTAPGAFDDAIVMFGGYRTTWGTLRNVSAECLAGVTSTTTIPPASDSQMQDDIVLTDVPSTTAWATTTTEPQASGVSVIGTFPVLGPTVVPTTTRTYRWTTTATTTVQVLVETYTSTTSTTRTTRTSTSSTTSMTQTTTYTGTTRAPTTLPTTLPSGPKTFPPVVAGITINNFANSDKAQATTTQAPSARIGPESCSQLRHYFDDLWMYEATTNQFYEHFTTGPSPMARKGHQIIARGAKTNDSQLMLFGGHNQDHVMNDLWILNLRKDLKDRIWTRIDTYIPGVQPPPVTYHTMIYSAKSNTILVFGGLSWKETELKRSDALRDIDRRCLKDAQSMVAEDAGMSEARFLQGMRRLCQASDFCCEIANLQVPPVYFDGVRIRTDTGALNLSAISTVCRADCQSKAFYPEFYPIMSEGVWTLQTGTCPADCNGNGRCEMSQCVCMPSWYGVDCSQQRCPGSPCYTEPHTKEQFCVDCSGHGRCINGQCQCFPGWGFDDCSAVLCEANCSSTPYVTRGICVEDFPVHQCICIGAYSGKTCEQLLCLNGCSGRGTCTELGTCVCNAGFYGEDCSLWTLAIQ